MFLGAVNKLADIEDRVRRAEDNGKENKSALAQLISHTKNVERAVRYNSSSKMIIHALILKLR